MLVDGFRQLAILLPGCEVQLGTEISSALESTVAVFLVLRQILRNFSYSFMQRK